MGLKVLMIDGVANSGIVSPEVVNYRHLGLYIKETMTKGLIVKNQFYRNLDGDIYSDLYVEENFVYHFNGVHYTGSTTTVSWYDSEDQVGFQNTHNKTFNLPEARAFGQNKRKNLLAIAEFTTLGLLGYINGTDFMSSLTLQTKDYIDGVSPTIIIAAINTQVGIKPYLTQQTADVINAILSDI